MPLLALALAPLSAAPVAQEALTPLDAATVQLDPDQAPFRRLIDTDGDGDLDAIGLEISTTGGGVRWVLYENDGDGAFQQVNSQVLTKDGPAALIEVADLNNDGNGDFVLARGRRLSRGYSDGNLGFPLVNNLYPLNILALATGDLNGDGFEDVVLATSQRVYYRLLGAGMTTLSTGTILHAGGDTDISRILLLDGNSDGLVDVVTASPFQLQFYDRGIDGKYSAGLLVSHDYPAAMVDDGDIDGDGDPDIALFDAAAMDNYRVLRCLGPGVWNLEVTSFGGPAEFLADVNGDGYPDGVCCGGGGSPKFDEHTEPSDFQVSLNDGFGNFAPAFKIRGVGSPQLAGCADVDGDGDADLVAGRCVYFNRGMLAASPTKAFPVPFEFGRRDVHDFDGDGDLDIGFSLRTVMVNDGDGNFTAEPTQRPDAPRGTFFVGPGYPGDFDDDGHVDLLVEHRVGQTRVQVNGLGHHSNHPQLIGMRFLRNDGTGALEDGGPASALGVTFSLGSLAAEASFAVDLEGDGLVDLVTRGATHAEGSRAWHNTGAGYFIGPYPVQSLRAEFVGDLSGDGLPEIVAVGTSDLLPQFEQAEMLQGIQLMSGLTGWALLPDFIDSWYFDELMTSWDFADVTADGHLDLVWADGERVWLGRDMVGTPAAPGFDRYSLGQFPLDGSATRIATGDLNGDGEVDYVVGPYDEPVPISAVGRKLGGTLASYTSHAQAFGPGLVLDVDGDGDLDVVGQEIVFNTTIP